MKKLGGKNRCVSRTGPALSEWETEAWVLCPHRGNSLSQTDSETADLWQSKWNENQTVLATAIRTPDRDASPLEAQKLEAGV